MNSFDSAFKRFIRQFWLLLILSLLCLSLLGMPKALASQSNIETQVSLGNNAGELKFFPSELEFQAGKQYKILLDNPSPVKHYFTAKDFADVSWTRKVQAGKVEVKGAIHELELKPGATAEWVLTPMKPGQYELHCSIKGHATAGMIGKITVAD
ncbi:cupredoxin domain-containing protein [Pleurocapsa sp. PCC 7319]|uniref:cupredoxin domain-containing protein n=1 Tax=Pleurocapsa sp. PCC 7319 TaxID=118161 RepID=UPI00035CED1A